MKEHDIQADTKRTPVAMNEGREGMKARRKAEEL